MRAAALFLFLSLALLMPTVGNAQVYRSGTPAPQVTAAAADWQVAREPIFFAGNVYYPTGPNVFFDQWIMSRTGTYKGVPLYVDSTLEAYSIVYVPIGGNLMRPYERRRDGELAGTVGNRTPSFPTVRDGEVSVATRPAGELAPAPTTYIEPAPIPEPVPMELLEEERPVRTSGSVPTRGPSKSGVMLTAPSVVESIPRPRTNRGIWITWDGTQWYPAGSTVPYDSDRFVKVGEYYEFPVYREKDHDVGTIFVPAVKGGLLTPYHR
jgi:hypothetical protein